MILLSNGLKRCVGFPFLIALEFSLVTKVGNLMHITCLLIYPQLIADFARALCLDSCFYMCRVSSQSRYIEQLYLPILDSSICQ